MLCDVLVLAALTTWSGSDGEQMTQAVLCASMHARHGVASATSAVINEENIHKMVAENLQFIITICSGRHTHIPRQPPLAQRNESNITGVQQNGAAEVTNMEDADLFVAVADVCPVRVIY